MKNRIRILSFVLAFVLFATSCMIFTGSSAASLGAQKNELESQLSALKEQQKKLKEQYNAASKDLSDQQAAVNLLYDQIETYQKELDTLNELMAEYTDLAAAKEKESDTLNEQMNKNFELFKERLVFAQESGNMSYIDFILGSSDLSDIISRSEVINDMLEYDRKIIEGLLSDREAIEKAKEEIELALQNCRDKQTQYDAIVVELKAKQAEAEEKLSKLKADSTEAKTALDRSNALKAQIENDLDKVIEKIAAESKGTYVGGDFIWPLPLSFPGAISRGWLTDSKGNVTHSGVDIHVYGWANNGKIPALAVASGTVVRRGYYSDWGNLIVVDHGGGYLTYYAHLDSFAVSVGQKVTQGQEVGKIGSTGRSTGPHLHLCFYAPVGANGASVRTDPLKYISYPR